MNTLPTFEKPPTLTGLGRPPSMCVCARKNGSAIDCRDQLAGSIEGKPIIVGLWWPLEKENIAK